MNRSPADSAVTAQPQHPPPFRRTAGRQMSCTAYNDVGDDDDDVDGCKALTEISCTTTTPDAPFGGFW